MDRLTCKICGKQFDNRAIFNTHNTLAHGGEKGGISEAFEDMGDKAKDIGEDVKDKAEDIVDKAGDKVK